MCEIKVNVECAGKEMKQKTIDKKKKLCGLTVEFSFSCRICICNRLRTNFKRELIYVHIQ